MFEKLVEKTRQFFSRPAEKPSKPPIISKKEQGKLILEKEIKEQQLLEKNVTPGQIRNLYRGLGEGLISIAIVKEFLQEDREWSNHQFIAMITDEGLLCLLMGDLSWKDFCTNNISDKISSLDGDKSSDKTISAKQFLTQLIQLKNLEMDFFEQASEDFEKKKTLSPKKQISNLYLTLTGKSQEHKEKSPTSSYPKSDAFISLPETDANIARTAMQHAQRYRKKGCSELDNNYRSPLEFSNLVLCFNKNVRNVRVLAIQAVESLKTQGLVYPENCQNIIKGAHMHYIIESAKSTFLANCDAMAILILDYLHQIGYKKRACLGHIEGHTFAIVEGEDGEWQIWDPWANKAYPYDEENILKHLQNWKSEVTSRGTANHQLENFDPNRHVIEFEEETENLKNLREFRSAVSSMHGKEITTTNATEEELTSTTPTQTFS